MATTARKPQYTLLYDGKCNICTSQSRLAASYDDGGRLELLDINSEEAQQRFPQITPEAAQRELHLAAPDGALYRGVEAVREALLLLPTLRAFGEVLRLPGAVDLARPIYEWVSRNRYWLGGRNDAACENGTCYRSPGQSSA